MSVGKHTVVYLYLIAEKLRVFDNFYGPFLTQFRKIKPIVYIAGLLFQFSLQALQAAHTAEALHSDYLLEWMRNISNDLTKLENDAAPSGWKCLWNRYVATIELYSMYLLLH